VSQAAGVSVSFGRVRERLIAALVPDVVDPRDWVSPLPLPLLPALRSVDAAGSAGLVVATARMDRSGRLCERILLRALGWEPGQHLEIDTMHGMIIIAATPDGPHTVDPRGGLGLPASLRRLCGIEPGPPLILAAAIQAQVLIVHPAATMATLLAAHYTDLIRTHHDTSP
jgi:bifunctional DNA-binding transcriptional regulator/antitoxin component of YhaV-PrlF toxin-antitoxin module